MASETLAEIVAEMRELAADIEAGNAVVGQTVWRNYADRIEAAAKREEDRKAAVGELPHPTAGSGASPSVHETVEVYHNPSNAVNGAAMREALTDLVNYLNKEVKRTSKCKRCKYRGKTFRGEPCYWHVDCGIDEYDDEASDNAMRLLKRFKLQEALAAPPRQCDVGTAAEQSRRFCAFCRPRTEPCDGCSCLEGAQHSRCEFIWAQMPYEEGGAK